MSGEAPPVRAPKRFDMSRLSVLVVDDSPHPLDITVQILRGFGTGKVEPCVSVSEAMSKLSGLPFDLVIADGEMPEQDGFDLTSRLRSDANGPNFTVPIMICSGFTPMAKVSRARDIGANMVLLKPVVPANLLERIHWLAKTPRQFVTSPGYCGPDRRFKNIPLPPGEEERRADAMRVLSQSDLSQDDIDSLFD